jgi:hypothetical protein
MSGQEIALLLTAALGGGSLYYVEKLRSQEKKAKIYFGYTNKKK